MHEFLNSVRLRWRGMRKRRQLDRDLEDEMAFHLAMKAEKNRELGVTDDPRKSFGNPTRIRENVRDLWTFQWVEAFWHDVRYSIRMLRRTPGFTLVAIASLAIGIGANSAIFSLADAILLKSIPVQDPQQLRLILWTGEPRVPLHNSSGYSLDVHGVQVHGSFPFPIFQAFAAHVREFSSLAGFANMRSTVVAQGDSHYAQTFFVSGNMFSTLGLNPLLGRPLTPEDDRPGAPVVAVVSYSYWETHLGLDPGVVGRTITVNGRPVTIAGVTPRRFAGLEPGRQLDLIVPLAAVDQIGPKWYVRAKDDTWWVQLIGRLQPGVTDVQLRDSLVRVMRQEEARYPALQSQKEGPWQPFIEDGGGGVQILRQHAEIPMMILSSVVGIVLLIGCANIANLLLARGTARRREIAVRLSIGAGRWRLVRQFLTESLLLSLAGGAAGLLLVSPLNRTILAMAAGGEHLVVDARLDMRTLLFTFLTAVATAILFGLLPALRATRVDLTPALKDGTSGNTGGRQSRLSRVLVVGQVALSTILLAVGALFVRTLTNLSGVDPGFDARNLIVFTLDASRSGYEKQKLADFYEKVRATMEGLPGVKAATLSSVSLISDSVESSDVTIPGYLPKDGQHPVIYNLVVGKDFHTVMGMPVLLGRQLNARDTAKSSRVAVVNETFNRKYLGGGNPLGRTFYFGDGANKAELDGPLEIVGVCKDAHYDSLKHEIPPTAYVPFSQNPAWVREAVFELRTGLPAASLAASIRRAVADMDRNVPISEFRTQEEQIHLSIGLERLFAELVGAFGFSAALLAAIGLYGLMAYAMARRTAEIGIRLALGARRADILWLALRDSVFLAGGGMALGIPAALSVTKLIRGSLYGVAPTDPLSFLAAGCMMLAIAGLAAWIPARRAARVDPIHALRYE